VRVAHLLSDRKQYPSNERIDTLLQGYNSTEDGNILPTENSPRQFLN
jgi:hypothetical protein